MGNEPTSNKNVENVIEVPKYEKPWIDNKSTNLSLQQSVSATQDELTYIASPTDHDQEDTNMDMQNEIRDTAPFSSPSSMKYQYHRYRKRLDSYGLEQNMEESDAGSDIVIESVDDTIEDPDEYHNDDQSKSSEHKHSDIDHEDDTIHGSITDTSYNPVYDDQCDDIWHCQPFRRIVDTLKYYQFKHDYNDKEEISEYFYENKHFIINDYHHILNEHLNEDGLPKTECNKEFCNIYQIVRKNKELCCNLNECIMYKRNNRQRERAGQYQVTLEMDILDNIHCYFLHSVDTGYRIIDEWDQRGLFTIQEDDDDEKGNVNGGRSMYFDEELSKLESFIERKKNIIINTRGQLRVTFNKFLTEIESAASPSSHTGHKHNNDEDEKSEAEPIPTVSRMPTPHLLPPDQYESKDQESSEDGPRPRLLPQLSLTGQKSSRSGNLFSLNISLNPRKDSETADTEFNNELDLDPSYNFGVRQNYWSEFGKIASKSNAYYDSIKFEVLNNKIYTIDATVFQNAYKKAQDLIKTSDHIKGLQCKFDGRIQYVPKGYGIKYGAPISINHLLSVILYTDYDTLSYKFKETFRKLDQHESRWSVQQRNKEFRNWSKYLTETINCYGTTMYESQVEILYHGVSFMYLDQFIAAFNSPTSMTTKLQIAAMFAKQDGVILELGEYEGAHYSNQSGNLRYFNTSFVSYHANEDERLFIQPPEMKDWYLEIVGIRNMKTTETYDYFIYCLSILTDLLSGTIDSGFNTLSEDVVSTINEFMDLLELQADHGAIVAESENYPTYITRTLKKWSNRIDQVYVNKIFLKDYAPGFAIWSDKSKNENLMRYDLINKIFPKITKIDCWNVGVIGLTYLNSVLSMLQDINAIGYVQLERIGIHMTTPIWSSSSVLNEYQELYAKIGWNITQRKDVVDEEIFVSFMIEKYEY